MVTYVVIGGSSQFFVMYSGTDEAEAKRIFDNTPYKATYEVWVNGKFYEDKHKK